MYLVDDIDEARARYERLGFKQNPTDDSGCVGLASGDDNIILVNSDYAERTLPAQAVVLMRDKPALYVFVESLDAMRDALRGTFLGEARMAGLREWVVEIPQGVVVLAESVRTH
jgi:hypothetical protein